MSTIDEVYSLVKYRANKSGYLGSISPDDFNLLFPRAELRYFNKEYVQYASTQRISDALSKFKSDPTAITVDSNGKYTIPADLLHVDAITHTISGIQNEVTRVESDRIANNLSSSYDAPSLEFPIYTQYSTYLQFYPITLATATLTYLKKPTTSVWGYTMNGTVLTTNTLVAGTGYTNGTYTNISLISGTGSGAKATIVVAGGVVTTVTITNGGKGYLVGNVLSAVASTIGGTGSGFSVTVATIVTNTARPVYNPATSVQPQWSDVDIDNIIYLLLQDVGIETRDGELEQFALQQSKINV